jgi:hypothetical protein
VPKDYSSQDDGEVICEVMVYDARPSGHISLRVQSLEAGNSAEWLIRRVRAHRRRFHQEIASHEGRDYAPRLSRAWWLHLGTCRRTLRPTPRVPADVGAAQA